ncbi:mechanosensitive ion channel family protein [Mycolicibacterium tusciae]|jgi:small-conductance mechanosensitive channel|uniref:Mechanosensitive ion channel protein MscS n=1 Tax=Mycolicibacterium tusciae TaxID=75922 RepID=A0A1X0JIZ5_9MYCO|nr:mechanosensitive ion channel family protein [Mycolicibacterium tusciae]ORB62217.1 mechanosensitive ion channel protein MscS [Mycolicibacterium tusciae]
MQSTLDSLTEWLMTKGLHIALVVVFAIIATRVIRFIARRISKRWDSGDAADSVLRPERVKHRRAVASVISSVAIAVLYVVVAVDIANQLGLPIGSLVAPAAVLGAALGFGAQRIVQDLLSGFFLITEKQYGFGDLVALTVTAGGEARGTVEDVTLRVTKLRTSDGEVFTVPNGQIVKSLNLSKDWARAVVDVPVPTSADINVVNDALREVSTMAMHDDGLPELLLDEPQLMGVESIEKDTVNLRVVARTLPGKQFEVSRRLRALIVAGLRRAGVADAEAAASRTG